MSANATKRLLNNSEELTDRILRPAVSPYGSHVYAKVRLADVWKIENSGITNAQFRFALQSHFDFTVTNDDHFPLFAVEFDGPCHRSTQQEQRDEIKNSLCTHFEFPLLRINSRYLAKTYRNMDLLTWFINHWFLHEAFDEAQKQGAVPYDEPFDAMLFLTLPGYTGNFPMWLSAEVRVNLRKIARERSFDDDIPSMFIGRDAKDNYYALGFMAISKDNYAVIKTGMRRQLFPVSVCEILSEIVAFEIHQEVMAILSGGTKTVPTAQVNCLLLQYQSNYEFASSCSSGEIQIDFKRKSSSSC